MRDRNSSESSKSQRRTRNGPLRVDCVEEAPSLPAVDDDDDDAVRAAGGQAIAAALEARMHAPSGRTSAVERNLALYE